MDKPHLVEVVNSQRHLCCVEPDTGLVQAVRVSDEKNFKEKDGENKLFQEKMAKPVVVAIQEGEQVTSTVELHGEIQMRRVLKKHKFTT